MLSKNKIKFINSLAYKKYRDETGCFVAEGTKIIADLAANLACELLLYTSAKAEFAQQINAKKKILLDEATLKKAATQKSPEGALAVFRKPQTSPTHELQLSNQLSIALDDIQDPGNLGTIIRIADWFGINHIFCSLSCADAYGPKVVQASMGALARVNIHYLDLPIFLSALHTQNPDSPIYGTFMDGKNIYQEKLTNHGMIVMGNEGSGISPAIAKLIDKKLSIPNYPSGSSTSESLNVAIATGIVCSEFRRTTASAR